MAYYRKDGKVFYVADGKRQPSAAQKEAAKKTAEKQPKNGKGNK